MGRSSADTSLSQWKRIISKANNASGSKRQWCQDNGISEKQLYYWQRKIRLQEQGYSLETAESKESLPAASPSSGFVELPFPADAGRAMQGVWLSGVAESAPVLMQVRDCTICVRDGVQEQMLRTVIAAVRNA